MANPTNCMCGPSICYQCWSRDNGLPEYIHGAWLQALNPNQTLFSAPAPAPAPVQAQGQAQTQVAQAQAQAQVQTQVQVQTLVLAQPRTLAQPQAQAPARKPAQPRPRARRRGRASAQAAIFTPTPAPATTPPASIQTRVLVQGFPPSPTFRGTIPNPDPRFTHRPLSPVRVSTLPSTPHVSTPAPSNGYGQNRQTNSYGQNGHMSTSATPVLTLVTRNGHGRNRHALFVPQSDGPMMCYEVGNTPSSQPGAQGRSPQAGNTYSSPHVGHFPSGLGTNGRVSHNLSGSLEPTAPFGYALSASLEPTAPPYVDNAFPTQPGQPSTSMMANGSGDASRSRQDQQSADDVMADGDGDGDGDAIPSGLDPVPTNGAMADDSGAFDDPYHWSQWSGFGQSTSTLEGQAPAAALPVNSTSFNNPGQQYITSDMTGIYESASSATPSLTPPDAPLANNHASFPRLPGQNTTSATMPSNERSFPASGASSSPVDAPPANTASLQRRARGSSNRATVQRNGGNNRTTPYPAAPVAPADDNQTPSSSAAAKRPSNGVRCKRPAAVLAPADNGGISSTPTRGNTNGISQSTVAMRDVHSPPSAFPVARAPAANGRTSHMPIGSNTNGITSHGVSPPSDVSTSAGQPAATPPFGNEVSSAASGPSNATWIDPELLLPNAPYGVNTAAAVGVAPLGNLALQVDPAARLANVAFLDFGDSSLLVRSVESSSQ